MRPTSLPRRPRLAWTRLRDPLRRHLQICRKNGTNSRSLKLPFFCAQLLISSAFWLPLLELAGNAHATSDRNRLSHSPILSFLSHSPILSFRIVRVYIS